jgi:hypothetical protein
MYVSGVKLSGRLPAAIDERDNNFAFRDGKMGWDIGI